MLKIGALQRWCGEQLEQHATRVSNASVGDRIISVDGLQGDLELMLNELRTNNKLDMTLLRRR